MNQLLTSLKFIILLFSREESSVRVVNESNEAHANDSKYHIEERRSHVLKTVHARVPEDAELGVEGFISVIIELEEPAFYLTRGKDVQLRKIKQHCVDLICYSGHIN